MIKKLTILLLLSNTTFSQFNSTDFKGTNIFGFAISPDDKNVLFAADDKNGCSIYKMDLANPNLKKVLVGTKELSFFEPRYSSNGTKIVCIGYTNQDPNNAAVYVANANGTNLKKLTNGNEIIRKALFSNFDSSSIIFTKSNIYRNYSPLVAKRAHDMDIYSVNLSTNFVTQISNFRAYSIEGISEIDSNIFLINMPIGIDGGMFYYDEKTKNLKRIVPSNDPRKYPSLYTKPKYSRLYNLMVFIAPYELYYMNVDDKFAKSIYRVKGNQLYIRDFAIFNYSKKILFNIAKDGFYSINIDGSNLTRISFVIDD